MRKVMVMVALLLAAALAPVAGAVPLYQQGDGQAYTIQANDTLGGLAFHFYGDFSAWPAIVEGTNAKAAVDSRFRSIGDPTLLQEGQLIWIPGPAEASRLLGRPVEAAPASWPAAATGQTGLPALTDSLLAELDNYIETSRVAYGIPGVAVAVVQGNDIVLAKGYGVRELGRPEPVTPETVFGVGSTTKAMTTMLVATLVDEGRLSWDEPVVDIWPDFKLSDPAVTASLPLRHLFDMSSGLPRRDLVWSGAGLNAEEMMASLAQLPLVSAPGTRYHYNNQVVASGGYIAALAAGGQYGRLGQAYADLLRTHVFEPIGMDSARLEPPAGGDRATPHDYTLDGQAVPTHDHLDPGLSPAGAVYANVLDMARFVQTELNQGVAPDGRRVVSTVALAETWQPAAKITDHLSYGMGWFIEDYQGVKVIWHDGDVLGFKSLLAFMPDTNVGLVVLSNRMLSTGFSYSIRDRLVELLYGLAVDGGAPFTAQWTEFLHNIAVLRAKQTPTVDPAAIAPYLGQYEGKWQVELRPDNTLWAIRGPYEWHLMAYTGPSGTPARDLPPLATPPAEQVEYMIDNGFGIATPLLLVRDAGGAITMTFKLYSGEVGAYRKMAP